MHERSHFIIVYSGDVNYGIQYRDTKDIETRKTLQGKKWIDPLKISKFPTIQFLHGFKRLTLYHQLLYQ